MIDDRARDGGAQLGHDAVRVGFKLHLQPTIIPGEAAYLVSRRGVTALHGRHAEVLVPLLDGSRTVAGVLREAAPALAPLAPEAARDALAQSLRELSAAGLLRLWPAAPDPAGSPTAGRDRSGDRCGPLGTDPPAPGPPTACPLPPGRTGTTGAGWGADADAGTDRTAEAYWDLAGLDGARSMRGLATAAVRVLAVGGWDPAPVEEACRASGLTLAAAGERADFSLVLCEDYLAPELQEVDLAHRLAGRPWLITKMCGADPWVGPVFRPGDGACWSCLASRLRVHRRAEWPVQRALGLAGPPAMPAASLAAGRAIALQMAVLETAKWLAGVRYESQDVLHTFDTLRLRARAHPVTRRPQCPECGDPAAVAGRAGAPFVPRSLPKASHVAGGHRALTAAQMLERYAHLVDPLTGIVKEIRRAPRSPDFVNSYLSGHNLAMGPQTLAGLRSGLRALSGGKGLSEEEARVGALCEAAERHSGTRHGDEPVVRASLRELGDSAVHPNSCQLYDDRQFLERDRWNASGSPFRHVPVRFDEERATEWTPVWSLTHERQRLLPTSMLYFAQGGTSRDGLHADSNGNAAGSSPEDALLQGFLELVERDAVALWWYNRTCQRGVDLAAFGEPYVDRLLDGYRGLGREVWVLDLTSDLGVPVMVALSRRVDKPAEDVIFGFGAHFDPRIALRRALTELGQLLPAVCEATAEGTGYGIESAEPLTWWRHATVANQPYLRPDPATPLAGPGSWEYRPREDLRDDVSAVTELVRARGMELLVLDQTRPDIGIPVVKVLVPGLRHFWARLAPGRLYDTPVELGRVRGATPYELLNPITLFV